jgi:hypothetical protein
MKWITRTHVHVDRRSCPWRIKGSVDDGAEFVFFARELVDAKAGRLNAIPFDVPGVELGHHDGHCSFVSIMQKYDLKDPALLKLAEGVNAADTGAMDKHPLAAGLEAVAQGFSLLYPDDHKNIEHQFQVYYALYDYFRLQAPK